MRAALLLAVVAAAVAAYLLLRDGSGPASRRGARPAEDASERADSGRAAPEPRKPLAPEEGEGLEEFAARAAAGGSGAVAEILAFLRSGADREEHPVWRFDRGTPRPIPTLRAAHLEALRRIPGPEAEAALKEAWDLCRGVGESYLCALAMSERQDRSFAAVALERAGPAPDPVRLHLQTALVELAAVSDPAATLEGVERLAPRGDSPADPQVPAAALRTIPGESVRPAVERLLAAPSVTIRAKSRYMDSLFRRGDLEAVRALRDAAPLLPPEMRIVAAHAAAQSIAFLEDAVAAGVAKAGGDARAMDAALARFEGRMEETKALVAALLGTGPGADAALAILEDRRKALPR